ncbi:MAG: transglutaminase family protein [Pseudomonadota bacterium]|nr:transglutaminase family protein [Pseudomonadota bacterium]
MRLSIRHRTVYEYDPAALRLALRLRLWPSAYEAQTASDWSVTVNGEAVSPLLTDDFGDAVALWHAHQPIGSVEIVATGTVETTDAAGVVRGLGHARAAGVFLRDTPLTKPDDAICELAATVAAEAGDDGTLAVMHALRTAVREAVDYRPGVTEADTTAARALALGAGVCQDHAHVFIAAARSLGVPARYVSGYLLVEPSAEDDEDEAAVKLDELNETHAWAEAFVEGLGWVGFDPSNDVCPTDGYVRLVAGLDANEAAPIRGSVTGQSETTLTAEVEVSRAQGQSQQQ